MKSASKLRSLFSCRSQALFDHNNQLHQVKTTLINSKTLGGSFFRDHLSHDSNGFNCQIQRGVTKSSQISNILKFKTSKNLHQKRKNTRWSSRRNNIYREIKSLGQFAVRILIKKSVKLVYTNNKTDEILYPFNKWLKISCQSWAKARNIWVNFYEHNSKGQTLAVYLTNRFQVAMLLFSNRSQMTSNVIRTKKWHTRRSRVSHWCSYHILTSSVIYYWTGTRQLGIYLFYIIKN